MTATTIEHCTVEDVFINIDDGIRAYLTEYLKPFAKPVFRYSQVSTPLLGQTLCMQCGAEQDGFLGYFVWGLAHGEGKCGKCNWPARMYHYMEMPDGEKGRIVVLLQYHPDFVEVEK